MHNTSPNTSRMVHSTLGQPHFLFSFALPLLVLGFINFGFLNLIVHLSYPVVTITYAVSVAGWLILTRGGSTAIFFRRLRGHNRPRWHLPMYTYHRCTRDAKPIYHQTLHQKPDRSHTP